ncbi:MAG TPA: M67 family metallopeptidase [Rhizomicrobium sp.]|nr:M67 family metallopeptidase [Rhizomicrobium sp.]
MNRALVLSGELRAQIEENARAALPRECCGLIEGVRAQARAIALHPVRNLAREDDRFEIDPADHIRLRRALRGSGREIIGCYHSHPDGRPELSARDRDSVAGDDFIWLVAAVAGGEFALAAFTSSEADAISPLPLAPIV